MEAEAEACLEGTRLTAEWVREPEKVESDCSQFIDALVSPSPTRASWTGILKDILAAGALLPEYAFDKIKREANSVAHSLAQQAIRKKECFVERFGFPSSIRFLIESGPPLVIVTGLCL